MARSESKSARAFFSDSNKVCSEISRVTFRLEPNGFPPWVSLTLPRLKGGGFFPASPRNAGFRRAYSQSTGVFRLRVSLGDDPQTFDSHVFGRVGVGGGFDTRDRSTPDRRAKGRRFCIRIRSKAWSRQRTGRPGRSACCSTGLYIRPGAAVRRMRRPAMIFACLVLASAWQDSILQRRTKSKYSRPQNHRLLSPPLKDEALRRYLVILVPKEMHQHEKVRSPRNARSQTRPDQKCAASPALKGRGRIAQTPKASVRCFLLLDVLAHNADGRASAGGGKVGRRPEHASPVPVGDIGAKASKHTTGGSLQAIHQ